MTGSISFEELKDLVRTHQCRGIRVKDLNGGLLYSDQDSLSAEAAISKLENHLTLLQAYGRVKVTCANDTQLKQNWKDCYTYYAHFTAVPTSGMQQPAINGAVPHGFVSQAQADLMAENRMLKLQNETNERMAKLERQLEDKDKDDPMQYVPMLGMLFDIPDERFQQMMKMQMMMSMKKNPAALAGAFNKQGNSQENNKLTVEGSDDDKVKKIQDNLDKLSEADNVTLDKLVTLTDALKDNPLYVDMALGFMAKGEKKQVSGTEKSTSKKRSFKKK